jgi:hypothetical protein
MNISHRPQKLDLKRIPISRLRRTDTSETPFCSDLKDEMVLLHFKISKTIQPTTPHI